MLHSQYQGYWCSGDARSQGMSSHDIYYVEPNLFDPRTLRFNWDNIDGTKSLPDPKLIYTYNTCTFRHHQTGIILGMCSTNERRHYIVSPTLTRQTHICPEWSVPGVNEFTQSLRLTEAAVAEFWCRLWAVWFWSWADATQGPYVTWWFCRSLGWWHTPL